MWIIKIELINFEKINFIQKFISMRTIAIIHLSLAPYILFRAACRIMNFAAFFALCVVKKRVT